MRSIPETAIIGLGNVTDTRDQTRHNVGRKCCQLLATTECKTPFTGKEKFKTVWRSHFIMAHPYCYMNDSGAAVEELLAAYPRVETIYIVHDNTDLKVGSYKIKKLTHHSQTRHRGLIDILATTRDREDVTLYSVAIGIGRPAEDVTLADYVLGKSECPDDVYRLVIRELRERIEPYD